MSDSIIKSKQSEILWVEQICKTFSLELVIDIDKPPCVFRVPKSLSDTNPEAYAPQQIGLGAYHHLRPQFYVLQSHKLAALKKFLTPEQFRNFQGLALDRLAEIEPVVRSCYDQFLDISAATLALIIAIDCVYLLHILSNYRDGEVSEESAFLQVDKDLVMLENQIPSVLLNEIRFALKHIYSRDNPMLSSVYSHFCKQHSPLELTVQRELVEENNSPHLLAYMYHLIVNNRGIIEYEPPVMTKMSLVSNLEEIVDIAASHGIGGAETVQKHIKFVQSLPWEKISGLFNESRETKDANKPVVEEIEIPSVTELQETAKVQFKVTQGGIRDIKFDEEERAFYLPVITPKPDSEVVLRNLMAYEAAVATPDSILELTEYVDLMCGIVDTAKDVTCLRNEGIIEGDLKDEEIVEIFNGISKSSGKNKKKKSQLEKAIDKVNEKYENTCKVKVQRFLKKHIYKSWKFLTVSSTVVLILLLALQAFCDIYGCSNRWFRKSLV